MRMDYMIDCGADDVSILDNSVVTGSSLKMIEFNTIAASMGSHATNLYRLHRVLLNSHVVADGSGPYKFSLEPNDVISGMADTLYQAHVQICKAINNPILQDRKPYILFVIQ